MKGGRTEKTREVMREGMIKEMIREMIEGMTGRMTAEIIGMTADTRRDFSTAITMMPIVPLIRVVPYTNLKIDDQSIYEMLFLSL